jgi:hypothetical protein
MLTGFHGGLHGRRSSHVAEPDVYGPRTVVQHVGRGAADRSFELMESQDEIRSVIELGQHLRTNAAAGCFAFVKA